MSRLMVSVSGVRGVFGESINPMLAMRFAAHFGIFCGKGKIVVGRDSRKTGPAMKNAIISALLATGCEVIDLGIVSTPTVLLAVEDHNANGGISITASHNPGQWNAMKFVSSKGMFLFPEDANEFLAKIDTEIEWNDWENQGSITYDYDASLHHIQKILNIGWLDIANIQQKKFKVVVDCVNGAGGVIMPALLAELGCEVVELNCEPTGLFAHTPEPLKKNLVQLEEAVKQNKADLGIAVDPDVDRIAFVDENGECIGEELSLALATAYVLSRKKGDVVTNLSTSMMVNDIAKKHGCAVHRVKVGEINVGKKMKDIQAVIGGEGNGGIILPEVHLTRDAPAGAALILSYLAKTSKKLSELCNEIPKYYFAKKKISLKAEDMDRTMQNASTLYANLECDKQDGYKYIAEDYWIHIRKSGTEPIIRIYVESPSVEQSNKICDETIKMLQNGL